MKQRVEEGRQHTCSSLVEDRLQSAEAEWYLSDTVTGQKQAVAAACSQGVRVVGSSEVAGLLE